MVLIIDSNIEVAMENKFIKEKFNVYIDLSNKCTWGLAGAQLFFSEYGAKKYLYVALPKTFFINFVKVCRWTIGMAGAINTFW